MTQPPPQKTDTPEVWPLVIADVRSGAIGADPSPPYWRERLAAEMEARNAFGIAKWKEPVRVENWRDPLRDALDEALDMSCYTRQQYEKTGRNDDLRLHHDAVMFASRILWRIHLRDAEVE
jgi:hypothetical protein